MKNIIEQTRSILQTFVDRVANGNYSKASTELGLDPGSGILRKWINGERIPNLSALAPVFERMGVTLNVPDERLLEYDFIARVAAKAGAGASLETDGAFEGWYAFRRDFLATQHISPKQSVLMMVTGDSMEPTFFHGDAILIDKSDIDVQEGKIYVVTLGEELRVKRLFKGVNGLILRSDNQKYPDISVTGPDLENFVVHGRVRWHGRVL